MNNDWKNTSTVYLQQHSRYYQWVLYPMIVLILGIILFLVLGSSEQVVHGTAKISSKNIVPIQVPIEASIQSNNLKENLEIKKGDALISFDVENLTKQKEQLDTEIETLKNKNDTLSVFIKSLEEEKNLFTQEDAYGYSNQINAFFKSKEKTIQANKQVENNYQSNVQNALSNVNQLNVQIAKKQSKLQELIQIRTAWINQQNIHNYSTEYMSQYELWQIQANQAQEIEKERVKATVLTEIDQLINQLQQAIDQLDIQKEAITTPVEPTGEINSQIAIVEQTKEQQIAAAKEKQKELLAAKEKNEVTLKSVENELKNSKILAPIDGTIHLNQSYEKVKDIPKGTVIADIYTKSNEKKLIVESQISSDKMSHIKVGMPIRMRLDRKGISEQILTGKVTEIAETSTTTEAGTFFVVKGEVKISEKNTVRYGLTGSLLFVIGKKTYWNQLMDFMFNND